MSRNKAVMSNTEGQPVMSVWRCYVCNTMRNPLQTRANHVILLEPALDPAIQQQAVARVHRITQRREVTVHRLLIRDTIEVGAPVFPKWSCPEEFLLTVSAQLTRLSSSGRFCEAKAGIHGHAYSHLNLVCEKPGCSMGVNRGQTFSVGSGSQQGSPTALTRRLTLREAPCVEDVSIPTICVQEAIWAVQESRQALVTGSSSALAAQHREAEMSEADIKALLDR